MEAKLDGRKPEVLSVEQQEKLRQFKVQTRIDNEKYLSSHPEVELLVGDFLSKVLLHQPADVRHFAADHFTDPELRVIIGSKLSKSSVQTSKTVHD